MDTKITRQEVSNAVRLCLLSGEPWADKVAEVLSALYEQHVRAVALALGRASEET